MVNQPPQEPVPGPPITEGLARLRRWAPDGVDRWLLVDVAGQRLHLLAGDLCLDSWVVSTAAAGLDAREDSGGTPPGVHRIERRLGAGAPPGMVFVSREPTGRIWPQDIRAEEGHDDADLILTRVLTLAGQEDGVNRGPGVDSTARYIYIHGTNAESLLGRPCSHGCVRMGNADVMALFERVREGDPVVIV